MFCYGCGGGSIGLGEHKSKGGSERHCQHEGGQIELREANWWSDEEIVGALGGECKSEERKR